MISYNGFEKTIKGVYESGNERLFADWKALTDPEKENLLKDIESVDFDLIKRLFKIACDGEAHPLDFGPVPFIPLPKSKEDFKKYEQAREAGMEHIKQGKVAAFLVAGGQGSRLGFDGPKGMFPVGPVSGKTLFQIHAEKIFKYSGKYNTSIPWLIMTSVTNHDETIRFMEEHNYFNLDRQDVIIFPQNMIPSLDANGKLVRKEQDRLFMNPDGHGGSLSALATSGALETLRSRKIETISYFQVDNPLIKIVDPVFIGFHVQREVNISSKAMQKDYPEEKIGIFVKFVNGRFGIIEYSDLPEEKQNLRDEDGGLIYAMGNPAIHLLRRTFIEELTSESDVSLPYHVARKKIQVYEKGSIKEIDGLKFEKFVFDAIPLNEKNIIFEIPRREEFAPVKNKSGVDSLETAQELMENLHRKWLDNAGVPVPDAVKRIEISPLCAVEQDDIPGELRIEEKEAVYLEG